MAVNPADMNSCNIKNTCVGGVNDGVAYDPGSPCGGAANVAFNPTSCDCEETLFCASGDCGSDVEWEVTSANSLWSLRPCGAPSCVIDCDRDEYRLCGYYTPISGSFYLPPGKCLNEVRQSSQGPCAPDKVGPGDGFIREDWYACDPGEENPNYFNCGTAVAQMPGGGYCSTIISGPGIQEVSRVERVKLAIQTTTNWTSGTTASATCGTCDGTITASGDVTTATNWRAPVEFGSASEVRFGSISNACGGTCPGTWESELGVQWVQIGFGTFFDASTTDMPCGVSDGTAIVATAGKANGQIAKGDKIAAVLVYGWTGAVGCLQTGSNVINSITDTVFQCYKPSELV